MAELQFDDIDTINAAATGDYGEAVRWQQQVLDAARRLERGALLPLLERHMQAYRAGRPCDEPWLP